MSILRINESYERALDKVALINQNGDKKVYILSLGCQQNKADSEKILGMAEAMGYSETDNPEEADLAFVNTCAVREHAELRAFSFIGKFKSVKEKNPSLILGVVGCMAAEESVTERIKRSFPYVSFTLEPNRLDKIPELVLKYQTDAKRSFIIGTDSGDVVEGMPIKRSSPYSALVSVMYGCNNFCSYCIVPYTRGRERSRDSIDVINECKALVQSGVREITLLGQNVNSYRSDMDFATLLDRIANIEGDFIIRFMTSHPKDVSDRLIEVMAQGRGRIAPHFHLPLQSGSDRILSLMNRTYTRDRFMATADKIREKIDGVALTSDIIVGFPTETDEDFADTLDVLGRVRFDMVYSFIYSRRTGTPAALMQGQVGSEDNKRRMQQLLDLQDGIALDINRAYLNKRVRALCEGIEGNSLRFRTDTGKLAFVKDSERGEECIGKFLDLRVTEAKPYNFICEF